MSAIEVTLSTSSTYIETLSIKPIKAVPGLTELVITTLLLNAKNPSERHVKTRCFVERAHLTSLGSVINQFLTATSSSDEPQKRYQAMSNDQ